MKRIANLPMYFVDFRFGDVVSIDDEGIELLDADAAHWEALQALADAISDAVCRANKVSISPSTLETNWGRS